MYSFKELLKEYVRLILIKGLNIQKDERLVITCSIECADFARVCTTEAYKIGCKEVLIQWYDDYILREKYLFASEEVFKTIDAWDVQFYDSLANENTCWLRVHSENPDNLRGVDPERIKNAQIRNGTIMQTFRKRQMKNEQKWCVCSVPIKSWAKAVFKDLDDDAAVMKLWDEIFKACRVSDGDALNRWEMHLSNLQKRVETLNSYKLNKLHFYNAVGTDVEVELIEDSFWTGGCEKTANGEIFSANIPSEEIFISPRKNGVNGLIVATKPLIYKGALVDDFSFVVKNGKIVEVKAGNGLDILRNAISVDEGASYFGEIALVPYNSPISHSGVLFYNTLYDENASCHFAFGRGFPCIERSKTMTEEEMEKVGINYSITHVDFMIGTPDLCIKGITHEGEEVDIFKDGNFAF